jgi:outer membrane protein TolC
VTTDVRLHWHECVREAIARNPDLLANRESILQTKASRTRTRSSQLPQVNASAGASYAERASAGTESYSYGLSASQLVLDGGKQRLANDRADESVIASAINYRLASANARLGLRTAFTGLLRSQKLVGITETILVRRKQTTDLVKLRYEAGREHRGSLLTTEAKQAQAELDVAKSHRSVSLARRKLSQAIGWSNVPPFIAETSIDAITVEQKQPDFAMIAANNPAVVGLASAAKIARISVDSARATFMPDVYVSASGSMSESEWPPSESSLSGSISLSVPLFEGGANMAALRSSRAAAREAQAKERGELLGAMVRLHARWNELQNAADAVEVQKKFLSAATERERIAEAQYSTGLMSFDNWTIIEDDLVRAENAMLETRIAVLTADAYWVYAKGGTLEEDAK